MTSVQIAYLVVLGVCILASGFFSGSETALVSVPRERVVQLLESDKRAVQLAALTADPDRMLSTLLVGNNLVNILGASVATVLFIDLIDQKWGPWVATAAVTSTVLLIGEITPKNLATRFPELFSLAVAPTIWRLSIILLPVTRLFLALSRGLFRLFGVDPNRGRAPITEDDIRAMAALGEREGDIEAAERDIIHAVFMLTDRQVREVMTPRSDIATLEDPVSIGDVRSAVSASGHSRFPVIEHDLDEVIGVLHVKDLLRMPGEASDADIRRVLREPTYVPETKPLLGLLHEMRARRRSFALVLDEHGGIEGLITIKDIVSELVGELQDEFDPSVPTLVAMGQDRWLADGRVPVDDLSTEVGIRFPEGPYTTVRLVVTRMDRNRIDRVHIERVRTD